MDSGRFLAIKVVAVLLLIVQVMQKRNSNKNHFFVHFGILLNDYYPVTRFINLIKESFYA